MKKKETKARLMDVIGFRRIAHVRTYDDVGAGSYAGREDWDDIRFRSRQLMCKKHRRVSYS